MSNLLSIDMLRYQECLDKGLPLWLAEIYRVLFNYAPDRDTAVQWGREMGNAISDANRADTEWDRIFRDIRLRSILPIALRSIPKGDGDFLQQCRDVVQWSIDNDGEPTKFAARVLVGARVVMAAWAREAAGAEEVVIGAGPTWAKMAGAAEEIKDCLVARLKEAQ